MMSPVGIQCKSPSIGSPQFAKMPQRTATSAWLETRRTCLSKSKCRIARVSNSQSRTVFRSSKRPVPKTAPASKSCSSIWLRRSARGMLRSQSRQVAPQPNQYRLIQRTTLAVKRQPNNSSKRKNAPAPFFDKYPNHS